MAGNKTRDGIKISKLLKAANSLGVIVRKSGGNHPYVLNYGNRRPCPIATSTDVRKMVVPWLAPITNYNNNQLYTYFRGGNL
jgi:hypothetical protein